jgi:hypothetical protein
MMITVMKAILKSLLLALVAATFSSCAGTYGGSYSSYGGGEAVYGSPYPSQGYEQSEGYVVQPSPYVTAYGQGRRRSYLPPTRPMVQAASNIQASYRGNLYDSYGFLRNGVYHQTAPEEGSTIQDYIQTQQQWPQ